ncbi:ABC transporter substrate-binding protein [Undibacterium sp. TJN25]|uniref:ABC transporter substrate-binding protein n=1 Tax=Undibacterium sp. TJN25 TaxID=3413056 RepID=UPI003BF0B314
MRIRTHHLIPALALGVALLPAAALAQKKYDAGASDTEIRIGNTAPYSGPASAYQEIAKAMSAYFDKVNAEGGINGRKVKFISVDDGYSPAKTVEQTRKLVEQDKVLFLSGSIGTGPQLAVQKYMNVNKIPQLFVGSGQGRFSQPKEFPWSMGFSPGYAAEGKAIGRYIAATKPDAKVAVIVPADDAGKDYLRGFKEGLADSKKISIVSEANYSTADATVDSQITAFKSSGADVFFNEATPKFAAQGIAKSHDIGWKPMMILPTVSTSVTSVLKPAGLEKSVGVVAPAFIKDPNDKAWENDKGMQAWRAWMAKYNPSANTGDPMAVQGYLIGELTTEVLKRCGDNLTRENILKQVTALKDVQLSLMVPGIRINTAPDEYRIFHKFQFQRFDGKTWQLFGGLVGD